MSNEEKILAILEEHSKVLAKQSATLDRHTGILEKQSEILERHGEILEKHGEILGKHSELLEKQGERLDAICADIAEMQQTLTKVAVTQEAVVLPKIQLLFEGHVTLAEKIDTLAPKERVEELEADSAIMKDAIKRIRAELAGLEKAQ